MTDAAAPPELGNEHDTTLAGTGREVRTRVVVLITAGMMALELAFGYATNSLALLADGWHMATHAGALSLSAGAYWFARTRARRASFAFGAGKVYALAGYTSAVALALVALWMAAESVRRFVAPLDIEFGQALPVAVLGLAVNVACAFVLQHEHEDGAPHDHNLRAAYLHVLADALTSVLAIAALVSGKYLGWSALDPGMGLVGAAVILRWSWSLARGAARQLLDAVPSAEVDSAVRASLESVDDVRVLDLHTWEIGPGRRSCVVSLFTSTPRETAYYRARVFAVPSLAHVTIEVHRAAPAGPAAAHSRSPIPS